MQPFSSFKLNLPKTATLFIPLWYAMNKNNIYLIPFCTIFWRRHMLRLAHTPPRSLYPKNSAMTVGRFPRRPRWNSFLFCLNEHSQKNFSIHHDMVCSRVVKFKAHCKSITFSKNGLNCKYFWYELFSLFDYHMRKSFTVEISH